METTYIHVNICGSVLRTLGRVVKGADSRKKARQTKKIHHGSGRTGSVRLVFTWSVSGLGGVGVQEVKRVERLHTKKLLSLVSLSEPCILEVF